VIEKGPLLILSSFPKANPARPNEPEKVEFREFLGYGVSFFSIEVWFRRGIGVGSTA
jgi:hypothetical protein